MAAAKKTAAKKPAAEVRTVSEDTTVPGISPELEDARKAALAAEADAGLKDANGALLDTEPVIEIDPELVKQREAALKAEADRKRY